MVVGRHKCLIALLEELAKMQSLVSLHVSLCTSGINGGRRQNGEAREVEIKYWVPFCAINGMNAFCITGLDL